MNNPFPAPGNDEERFRGPQLEEMPHRFPNVILHAVGHSLAQRVTARPDATRRSAGYWEVRTGSPLVFPMQARLLEITDNGDGTLSIFSTVYDMAAPIDTGDAEDPTPDDGVNEGLLASLARRAAVTARRLEPEAAGLGPSDRNVELLLPLPFDLSRVETPGPQGPGPTGPTRIARRRLLGLPAHMV